MLVERSIEKGLDPHLLRGVPVDQVASVHPRREACSSGHLRGAVVVDGDSAPLLVFIPVVELCRALHGNVEDLVVAHVTGVGQNVTWRVRRHHDAVHRELIENGKLAPIVGGVDTVD